jgi:hypothetical protein
MSVSRGLFQQTPASPRTADAFFQTAVFFFDNAGYRPGTSAT